MGHGPVDYPSRRLADWQSAPYIHMPLMTWRQSTPNILLNGTLDMVHVVYEGLDRPEPSDLSDQICNKDVMVLTVLGGQ